MAQQTDDIVAPPHSPHGWDDAPRPKRNGRRGMLPSAWLSREVRLEYLGAGGQGLSTSGTLLDWYPCGPILNVAGARTLVAWDRICLVELVGD